MKKAQTYADVHLGRIYFDILLEQARNAPGKPIRYGDMVERAKAAHPEDDIVKNAINISVGRRLDVVVKFCREHELPDLACLAVNQGGTPGERYEKDNGVVWEKEMARVAGSDWNEWTGHWNVYVTNATKSAITLKRVKEQDARAIRYEYFNGHRGLYSSYTEEQAEAILELIMEGHAANSAFEEILGRAPEIA